MVAGAVAKVTIWRMTPGDDDYVGGATITGTPVYVNIGARMQANPDDQILLQQGLETLKTFNVELVRGGLDIRERDEMEFTFPPNTPYINQRFRIIGVRYSDFTDPRQYMLLSVQRSVRSHRQQ